MANRVLRRIKQYAKRAEKKIRATKAYYKFQTIKNASTFRRLYEQELERVEFFKEHTDICSLKPATGELRGKQKNVTAFLVEVVEMLEKIGIYPFLDWGSLLGAVRHKGFIPWDDDVDLGITREEYCKLIEYAKEHWIIELYDGKLSEYTVKKRYDRIDQLLKKHPEQWILEICVNQLQIFRGTSITNRLSVDLFTLDSFPAEYTLEKHLEYLRELSEQQKKIDYMDKVYEFKMEQIHENSAIGGGKQYYFGIEGLYASLKTKNDSMIPKNVIFPLKKIEFEGHTFWAPQDEKAYLSYEYKNYMDFPPDVGIPKHNYYEEYVEENLTGIDFYLIDSMEISHFLPFYYEFKRRGTNVAFVCELPENGTKSWFDYENAKKRLIELGVKFREKINPKAAIIFTTQDAHNLSRYRGIKIFCSYGVSLYKKSFFNLPRVTDGFNYSLVHGQFTKDILVRYKPMEQILVMGYPKHETYFKANHQRDDIYKELGMVPDRPVLLYFPTWDENASIQVYAKEMKELKKEYYIITKPHHCTWHLEEKKEDLKTLYAISDLVLEGNYDFGKSTLLGDVAICDAKSGASSEVGYLNPNLEVVLVSMVENYHENYYKVIDKVGTVVTRPSELIRTVKDCFQAPKQKSRDRETLYTSFFGERDRNYVEEVVDKLLESAKR